MRHPTLKFVARTFAFAYACVALGIAVHAFWQGTLTGFAVFRMPYGEAPLELVLFCGALVVLVVVFILDCRDYVSRP